MESVSRVLPAEKTSFFLFGPRGTGKTTWLAQQYPEAVFIDLLDDRTYRTYLAKPERLIDFVDHLAEKERGVIIIDEVQKVPAILSLVHQQMEKNKHLQFILTGSSSRKLKRSGVDLLAGRAILKQCHPFMAAEIPESFSLSKNLTLGMLPLVLFAEKPEAVLSSYITLYLKEEVLQEGIVRNIESFSRYLETISFSHGSMLNVSEIAREADVSRKTVEGYIQITHDLLLSGEISVFSKRAKRNLIKHNKFYFFDSGVFCSLRPKGPLDRPEEIAGPALEGLVLQHLNAWLHYSGIQGKVYFWRTKSGSEVDFVLYGENLFYAFEIKNSTIIRNRDINSLKNFALDYPEATPVLLYRGEEIRKMQSILCYPVEVFLRNLIPHRAMPLVIG